MKKDDGGNIIGVVQLQQPNTTIGLQFLCCSSEPHSKILTLMEILFGLNECFLYLVKSGNLDNGGATTSRQDWVLTVRAMMNGNIEIMEGSFKVQVVATPGRKTKHNGPVAGPSSAITLNAIVENASVLV